MRDVQAASLLIAMRADDDALPAPYTWPSRAAIVATWWTRFRGTEKVELSGETVAAIWGGVAGALASGVGSFALQLSAQRHAARQQLKRDAEVDSAALQNVFLAAQECASASRNYRAVIEAAEDEARGRPLWQALRAFAAPHAKVALAPASMSVLLKLKLGALFNDVRDAITTHNGAHDAWEAYARLRGEFGRLVPANVRPNGRGTTELTREQVLSLSPLIAEMESISGEIQSRCRGDEALTRRALEGIAEALRKHGGIDVALEWDRDRAPIAADG